MAKRCKECGIRMSNMFGEPGDICFHCGEERERLEMVKNKLARSFARKIPKETKEFLRKWLGDKELHLD